MSLQARRLQRRKSAYTPFPLGDPNTVRAGGTVTYDLSGTNITRDTSQLIRYTRTATQTTTPTNMYGVEIVVSLSTNKVISVNNRVANNDANGTAIPEGTYVLSGHGIGAGYAGQWLLDNAPVGTIIELLTIIKDLKNFAAAALSTTEIKLTWEYSGATLNTFTITRGGSVIATATASDRSFTDTGLIANTSYTYTVTGNYQAGGTTATLQASARTQTTGGGSGAYPANEIAWYMKVFNSDQLQIPNIPNQVDAVRLSFALQTGGSVQLAGYTNQGQAALSQACNNWRNNGGFVVVSAGGGAGGQPAIDLSNPTGFANDIAAIQSNLNCPLDGLDWDLEYNADPNQVLAASNALKSRFGSNFVINYSAGGASNQTDFNNRLNCGVNLQNAGLLTSFSWQFYDTPVDLNLAKGRLQWLIDGGIPADKLMVGMFISSDPGKGWTNATCISYMTNIRDTMGIHRVMVWTEGFTAESAQWAVDMRNVLGP